MFRDVPGCSGMFRDVPCSGFYRRPPGRWCGIAGPVQASSLSCSTCEPSRLRTITIMKSVRFSHSLFGSYYVIVLKVIKLRLFGPSRSSNCIDGLLIKKKLHGTNMFVNEDYSDRVIKKRTELTPKLKEARRKNQRAFLRFDKLVIYDNPVNSGSTTGERVSGESSNAD